MDSAHALAVGRIDPPLCDYGNIKEHIDTEKVRWTCPDGVLTMTTYPRVPGSNALELSSEPYVKTWIERPSYCMTSIVAVGQRKTTKWSSAS